ncbi:TPA: hypothetical protein PC790_001109 [Clostridioides difficile]|nr:hypothetical protein [Clostridioides difficile]
MFIRTIEGLIYQVNIGDYIIQGVKGEIYPCKADTDYYIRHKDIVAKFNSRRYFK